MATEATQSKIALITGANRGMGLAMSQLLAKEQKYQPVTLLATSRAGKELDLPKSSGFEVHYHKLDVTNQQSVEALAQEVEKQYGRLDVLINNAGVMIEDGGDASATQTVVETNYTGSVNMTEAFLPLLQKSSEGRVVFIGSVSGAGAAKEMSPEIAMEFRKKDLLVEDLNELMGEFVQAAKDNQLKEQGWPTGKAYGVTKFSLNALAHIFARDSPNIKANTCCVGWCDSDMGRQIGKPPKSPLEGAIIPLKLAFGDIGDTTGQFWANKSIRSKEDGQVQQW